MSARGSDGWFTWRIPAFGVILAVALILGFSWRSSGEIPQDTLDRPQVLEVFVSDPSALVELSTVILFHEHAAQPRPVEELYLNISPSLPGENVNWAVVSLKAPLDNGVPALLSYGTEPQIPPEKAWVVYGRLSDLRANPTVLQLDPVASDNAFGNFVGGTSHIEAMTLSQGGVFYAHLPAEMLELPPEPGVNMLLAPERHGRTLVIDELPQPRRGVSSGSSNPLDYVITQRDAEPLGTPFFIPRNATTSAVLEVPSGESHLVDYHVDSVSPVDGSLRGLSYDWQGGTSMEPTLSASDPAANQTRADDQFLAGVAFAVAAAAVIALVQELPRRFRRTRHREESTVAEGLDPAKFA